MQNSTKDFPADIRCCPKCAHAGLPQYLVSSSTPVSSPKGLVAALARVLSKCEVRVGKIVIFPCALQDPFSTLLCPVESCSVHRTPRPAPETVLCMASPGLAHLCLPGGSSQSLHWQEIRGQEGCEIKASIPLTSTMSDLDSGSGWDPLLRATAPARTLSHSFWSHLGKTASSPCLFRHKGGNGFSLFRILGASV